MNGTMKRAQLPLTALRAFEVTARHRSLKLACAEMNLTPGAVSQQVRALEERLGVQLFDRTSGRYELTPIGARLLPRLTHCFDGMENAVQEVIDHTEPNRLRLKLAPTFAARWLAPRLEGFFAHNPGIDLEVATMASTSDLDFEHCDFLVQFGQPPWPDVDHILLFKDALVPVCAPKVAKSLRKLEDLAKQTLLHSAIWPNNWSQWLASAGLDLALASKGPKFPNALFASEAAASGAGVAVMQRVYVEADLAQGRLVTPFKHVSSSENGYYLVSSKYRSGERKIRDFRHWIKKLLR
jgi:DNA-binding transcriptional LysR family regulator